MFAKGLTSLGLRVRSLALHQVTRNFCDYFHSSCVLMHMLFIINLMKVYIENNTWVRGNTRFISSVEHDISRVSAANE